MSYLIVFIGAGIGGALRHLVNRGALVLLGAASPMATLAVNVAGSLAMGVIAGLVASRPGVSQPTQLFLATGILGGFTTFSAFSLDTAGMIERGDWWAAGGYAAFSLIGSVGALFAGLALVRAVGPLS